MLHSKATAALLRLKEIDKKYRISQLEKGPTSLLVSTENSTGSSLTSPNGVSVTSRSRINSGKDPAVSKQRLEIQMPETYMEYKDDIFLKEKESSTEVLSKTERSLRNLSTKHLETSSSTTMEHSNFKERLESASKSQEKSDNSFSRRTSGQLENEMEEIVTSDISTHEDILTVSARTDSNLSHSTSVNTNKNSRKINTAQSTLKDRARPETEKVETLGKNVTPELNSVDKHIQYRSVSQLQVNNNIEYIQSSESSKDYKDVKQREKDFSENYTNDSFEETLHSTVSTTDNEQSQPDIISRKSGKTDSDSSEKQMMFGVKKIDITPRPQRVADQKESDINNKQLIEIVAPKVMEKTSEIEVDFRKDLSEIVKNAESIEDLAPILLLKSTKHKPYVKKHKRKHRIPRKSQDDSLTDDKSSFAKIPLKADSVSNEASGDKKTVEKNEPKMSRRKKSVKDSTSIATSNSHSSSSKKSAKKFSTNVKTKRTEPRASSEINSKQATPRSVNSAAESQDLNEKLIEKVSDENLSVVIANEGQIINTETLSVSEKDESRVKDESKRTENLKNTQTNVSSSDRNEKSGNTIDEESVNNKVTSLTRNEKESEGKDEAGLLTENLNLCNSEEMQSEFKDKSDVTSVLRKLNKDALEAVTQRHKTAEHQFPEEQSAKNVQEVCVCGAQGFSSFSNVTVESNYGNFSNTKMVTSPTSAGSRRKKAKKQFRHLRKGLSCLKKEDEYTGLDRKQIYRLRKRMNALKLQEERQSLQRYFRTVGKTFPEVARGDQAFIKPLEFPKIEAFARPDTIDEELRSDDKRLVFYERVLAIRQWLKDRLVQYKTYSKLAQTVNVGYVPTTLQDTRKTIRELRPEVYNER